MLSLSGAHALSCHYLAMPWKAKMFFKEQRSSDVRFWHPCLFGVCLTRRLQAHRQSNYHCSAHVELTEENNTVLNLFCTQCTANPCNSCSHYPFLWSLSGCFPTLLPREPVTTGGLHKREDSNKTPRYYNLLWIPSMMPLILRNPQVPVAENPKP